MTCRPVLSLNPSPKQAMMIENDNIKNDVNEVLKHRRVFFGGKKFTTRDQFLFHHYVRKLTHCWDEFCFILEN